MGLIVPLLLAVVGSSGIFAAVVKLWPERNNLSVEGAQKAVALMVETMNELGRQLEEARVTVHELQVKLDTALSVTHQLQQALDLERAKVAQLERRIAELTRRQTAAETPSE